jgi:4-amino-4-deoxy-L-arabinose transferase-like glycosyltransferase
MSTKTAVGVVLLFAAAMLGLRIAGPSDIDDNDQPGPLSHIVDVAVNGQMLMQHDPAGRAATKPPMYPWLGAAGVWLTGATDEWVLKLPLLTATVVITLVVFDLARRKAGSWAAAIAAVAWLTNFHVLKLSYTARTDMLVGMWIAVALWCVELQRQGWNRRALADGRRSSLWLIGLFWLCVAGGALTKGPPVALAIIWLVGAVAMARHRWASRPAWQLAGLIGAVGLVLAWAWPTIALHPDYLATIQAEVVDRTTGQGTGGHRNTMMLAVPLYFVRSFAPWSIPAAAVMVAAVVWLARSLSWRRTNRVRALRAWAVMRQIGWPAWWMLLVIVFFAIRRRGGGGGVDGDVGPCAHRRVAGADASAAGCPGAVWNCGRRGLAVAANECRANGHTAGNGRDGPRRRAVSRDAVVCLCAIAGWRCVRAVADAPQAISACSARGGGADGRRAGGI